MFVWKDDSIMSLINELLRISSLGYITKYYTYNMQKVPQVNVIFPIQSMTHSGKLITYNRE